MANNHGNARIDYYGTDELIQKLDRAGANVIEELAKALRESAKRPKEEMLNFIKEHRKTGATEESFTEELVPSEKKGLISYKIGFNLDGDKPGLPALFLNYGTPFQEPYFFIDKAIANNLDEIKRVQEETLTKALEEIKL